MIDIDTYRIALEDTKRALEQLIIVQEALKASEARVKELEAKLKARELSDDELYNIVT